MLLKGGGLIAVEGRGLIAVEGRDLVAASRAATGGIHLVFAAVEVRDLAAIGRSAVIVGIQLADVAGERSECCSIGISGLKVRGITNGAPRPPGRDKWEGL